MSYECAYKVRKAIKIKQLSKFEYVFRPLYTFYLDSTLDKITTRCTIEKKMYSDELENSVAYILFVP